MTNKPKVTQADRDAAADYLCSIGQHGSAQQCRDGKGWRTTAETFAAHREQSTAALRAKNARLREVLSEICTMQAKFYGDGTRTHLALGSLAAKARQALTEENQDD